MSTLSRRFLIAGAGSVWLARNRVASAHSFKIGEIAIGHPWALPTSSENGAAFITLANRGRMADKLLGASSPVARSAVLRDGEGLPVKSFIVEIGRPIAMRPGARHIALLGLSRKLAAGSQFDLALRFENAGEIPVTVMVETQPSD